METEEATMRSPWWRGVVSLGVMLLTAAPGVCAQESGNDMVIYDFEGNTQEWIIPEWARTSPDYVAGEVNASKEFAAHGTGSLQLLVNFPGQSNKWTGAYTEVEIFVNDWTQFSGLAADVYVPYNTPAGLKGRIILTVGGEWKWTEMNRSITLKPDQWTTIAANLKPGSMDWKFFPDDAFRKDIRKIGIRIESDRGAAYNGPIVIDNVRLLK